MAHILPMIFKYVFFLSVIVSISWASYNGTYVPLSGQGFFFDNWLHHIVLVLSQSDYFALFIMASGGTNELLPSKNSALLKALYEG